MKSYIANPTEEQTKIMTAFSKTPDIKYEKFVDDTLPINVLEGIAKGRADIAAGRTISLEEFKKRLKSK
jgi:hypothetical protein